MIKYINPDKVYISLLSSYNTYFDTEDYAETITGERAKVLQNILVIHHCCGPSILSERISVHRKAIWFTSFVRALNMTAFQFYQRIKIIWGLKIHI